MRSWIIALKQRLQSAPPPAPPGGPSPQERFVSAVIQGDVTALHDALGAGADPNIPLPREAAGSERAAIQHAVRMDHIGMLRVLLAARGDSNKATEEEWYPPAHRAVLDNAKEAALLLHRAGVNWHARAQDPVVGEWVSAYDLVNLRRHDEFSEWFARHVQPLATPFPVRKKKKYGR